MMSDYKWEEWEGGYNEQVFAMARRRPDITGTNSWHAEGIRAAKRDWAAGLRRIYDRGQDVYFRIDTHGKMRFSGAAT